MITYDYIILIRQPFQREVAHSTHENRTDAEILIRWKLRKEYPSGTEFEVRELKNYPLEIAQ